MINIEFKDNILTSDSIDILNATVVTALPEGFHIDTNDINWTMDTTLDKHSPVITGEYVNQESNIVTVFKPHYVVNIQDGSVQFTDMNITSMELHSPVNYKVTPLSEVYILSKLKDKKPEKRHVHSQLSACANLIKEMYTDDEDYDINKPIPKLFFTKIDMDCYLGNLAVTLEESILFWMESTGRLSVSMDDSGINTAKRLAKSVKRVFMFGPARNKVKVEFIDGDEKDFSLMPPSAQVEICNEILSILPE